MQNWSVYILEIYKVAFAHGPPVVR